MINDIIKKIFWDPNEKQVKKYFEQLTDIKEIEERLTEELTTIELVQAKTRELMTKFEWLDLKNPEDKKRIREINSEIKFEAIATHRIACRLINWKEFDLWDKKMTWNMVPFDVQLVWALALNDWNISEMKTWEWKTLVATISAYLNALAGIPVHIVTVNDYLAQRDAKEMGIIYNTLWLSVWVIVHSQDNTEKQENYKRNVVYITNNELWFDYLRDNMAISKERRAIGPLFYAIVDEVDSILVDEARTPLIISAPDMEPTSKYKKFAQMAKVLKDWKHYKIDEKWKTATLTEEWIQEVEKMLWVENIYVSTHYNDIHHIENALKAETVYIKDVDYLNRNDEILIIDEHTGRVLSGRRYSDGLHQAIEAKENVTIQQESKTLASITFQNLFRLYSKLSWMTGTAKTEEEEFIKIYNLEVMVIPTNRPMIREDKADLLFKNEIWKFKFLVKLIAEYNKKGQPILVGTVSVAKSEYLSNLLTQAWVPHEVLNAKQDMREAEIISKAWHFWSVTIATNMAWRWTDIKIDEKVKELEGTIEVSGQIYKLGWLVVIGTEKHETRRIDNQLRGRSGRQWDPGLSQFMVSPQDDIMRIFGWDKLFSVFNGKLFESVADDEPLAESGMLTNRINSVQKQVEWRNFDTRKHVLEYDDILNHHRIAIYSKRNRILEQDNIHEEVLEIINEQVNVFIEWAIEEDRIEKIEDPELLIEKMNAYAEQNVIDLEAFEKMYSKDELKELLKEKIITKIEWIKSQVNEADFYDYEKRLYLQSVDDLWMRHIDDMSHLREEVAFEWYAQKNPLIVYQEKAYEKFISLLDEIGFKVMKWLLTANPNQKIEQIEISDNELELLLKESWLNSPEDLTWLKNLISDSMYQNTHQAMQDEEWVKVYKVSDSSQKNTVEYPKVWRNDPCPCWSWKKYKHCHGA
ncbi:MAG: Preprotein translocase, SecA subunit [uncultured bacterium (gcode 4)]|uniref:Protein translocase subunit SecA n=1 Tax=uncultured bacterium (gcode 4) TaxID=1234023 RepID=K2H2B6_9BACT|nr:MAG: Preprotein translocase, SecA subunit [uncultured bacterium (gcode 4)]